MIVVGTTTAAVAVPLAAPTPAPTAMAQAPTPSAGALFSDVLAAKPAASHPVAAPKPKPKKKAAKPAPKPSTTTTSSQTKKSSTTTKPSSSTSSSSAWKPTASTAAQAAVLDLVNQERAAAGLKPLAIDKRLSSAAAKQSVYQAQTQQGSHTGSGGSNPGSRISAAGYSWSTYGENVAWGYTSASAVMAGWMGSAGHKANILNPSFTHMGLATAKGKNGVVYWTQVFAAH